MGNKDVQSTTGKGGAFKEETITRNTPQGGVRPTLTGIADFGRIVEAVVAAGGYMSIGQTTDGGALILRILHGDKKLTTYCANHQQLQEAIFALVVRYRETYEEAPLPIQSQAAKAL